MTEPERARLPTPQRAQQEPAWLAERHEGHDGIHDFGGYAVAVPSDAVGAVAVEIDPHRIERHLVTRGQRRPSVFQPLQRARSAHRSCARRSAVVRRPPGRTSGGVFGSRPCLGGVPRRRGRSPTSSPGNGPPRSPGQAGFSRRHGRTGRPRCADLPTETGCQATAGALGEPPMSSVVPGGLVQPIRGRPYRPDLGLARSSVPAGRCPVPATGCPLLAEAAAWPAHMAGQGDPVAKAEPARDGTPVRADDAEGALTVRPLIMLVGSRSRARGAML